MKYGGAVVRMLENVAVVDTGCNNTVFGYVAASSWVVCDARSR